MIDELNTLALMRARDQGRALLATVRRAMIEVERPARHALVCLLADGHLLIEDVPGVGKTTLARIIARAIGGHDSRIQCTADLVPADIIGIEIRSDNPALRPHVFDPGPLFANAVVLDEVNRATPKLQAALFEAMEERFVSVAKKRHPLPRPFFVVATMNPYNPEEETFRLAHGQRDRFAHRDRDRLPVGAAARSTLLDRFAGYDALADIDPIVAPGDVVKVQRGVALVHVPDMVREYIVQAGARDARLRGRQRRRLAACRAVAAALLPGAGADLRLHRGAARSRAGAVRAVPRAPHAVPARRRRQRDGARRSWSR